jgi:hypothetical protein
LRHYARRLAERAIAQPLSGLSGTGQCTECGAASRSHGEIRHFDGCAAGQVLHALDRLAEPVVVHSGSDLSALVFEAHALALSQIMQYSHQSMRRAVCQECSGRLDESLIIGHTRECRAGRVLRRLRTLMALAGERGSDASLSGADFAAEPDFAARVEQVRSAAQGGSR